MKSTQLKKGLVLNKKTVANLDDAELNQVKGGKPWTDPSICVTSGCSINFCPEQ